MKPSKALQALVPITAVVGYTIAKKVLSKNDTTGNIVEETLDNKEEPLFGNLPLSEIERIAALTYRGVKAEITNEGSLLYYYKSASGKHTFISELVINSAGELVKTIRPYIDAKSPRLFTQYLVEALQTKNK